MLLLGAVIAKDTVKYLRNSFVSAHQDQTEQTTPFLVAWVSLLLAHNAEFEVSVMAASLLQEHLTILQTSTPCFQVHAGKQCRKINFRIQDAFY